MSAAKSEFARAGFAEASLEVIAAQAGVSRQLIYNKFGTKRGLYAAVQDSERSRLFDILIKRAGTELPPLAAISMMMEVLFDNYASSPLFRPSVACSQYTLGSVQGSEYGLHSIYDVIDEYLAQGRRLGEVRRAWSGRVFLDSAATLIVGIAAMGSGSTSARKATIDFIIRALTAADDGTGQSGLVHPQLMRERDVTSIERIVTAAEVEFSQSGVEYASFSSVSARAGVSKQLVYYYFKDKQTLYKAVHDRLVYRVLPYFEALDLESLTPRAALCAYVATYEKVQAAYPNSMKLDLDNRLQRGAIEVGDAFGRNRMSQFLRRLEGVIRIGQVEGSIHHSMTARLLFNLSAIIFCWCGGGVHDKQCSTHGALEESDRRSIAREFIICGCVAQPARCRQAVETTG